MKLGTENRKKTIAAVVLFLVAVLVVLFYRPGGSSATAGSGTGARPVSSPSAAPGPRPKTNSPIFSSLDPSLRLDLLKGSEEVAYSGSGNDIFRARPEPTPEPVPTPRQNPFPTPDLAAAPTPIPHPPINLKFYGFSNNREENIRQVFLSEGDHLFVVKEGDIVKGRYKIVRVNPNSVEVEDVLGNYRQSIPLTTG